MCVLPYEYRKIFKMLLKLTKLCEIIWGAEVRMKQAVSFEDFPESIPGLTVSWCTSSQKGYLIKWADGKLVHI